MRTQMQETTTRSSAPALLLGILIGIAMFALFVRYATQGPWEKIATVLTRRPLSIDTSQPAVVNKIQRMDRLETVKYSLDKVVEGDRENSVLPNFLAGDKLLMVVHGEVIAGVDLSQLKPSDVQVAGKSVTVKLPPAQIFVTALDNSKTRVYSRDTGLLVTPDPNLESQVRTSAQQQIQQAALADGILAAAQRNADSTIAGLLRGLGFQHVTVQ